MDHRVEPPSWLPEAAAPEGGGPAPGDSTVSTEPAAADASASNGEDGTTAYEYGYDSSYPDSEDNSAVGDEEGTYLTQDPPAGDGQPETVTPPVPTGVAAPSYYPGFTGGVAFSPEPRPADPSVAGAGLAGPGSAETVTVGVPGPAAGLADPVAAGPGPVGPAPVPAAPGLASPDLAASDPAAAGTPATDPPAAPGPASYRGYAATSKPKQAAPARRAASLVIARLEPWSVMKFSFLMSLVAWIVLFVAVAILYYALSGLGVFAALQRTLSNVTSSQGSAGVSLSKWTSAPRVLGYTMLIGAVNVVLITALSTVGAMIYNLVTHLGGGIEVTLKETD